MNIDQFTNKLNGSIDVLASNIPGIVDSRALNAIAMIKDRFIQKGIRVNDSGEETSFPAYSKKYDEKKTKEGKQGAGSANRLVYTGAMLRQTAIIDRNRSENYYGVIIGGTSTESQDKIDYNSERYDDILRLSKAEIKLLEELATEDLLEIFRNSLE